MESTTGKIELTSEGLKNALKKYSIAESIVEYVWNGFDAKAKKIQIYEKKNELGGTINVSIVDDGEGIDRSNGC